MALVLTAVVVVLGVVVVGLTVVVPSLDAGREAQPVDAAAADSETVSPRPGRRSATPTPAAGAPTSPNPTATPGATEPTAGGGDGSRLDLDCGSGYVVVLTSTAGPTPEATVAEAFAAFPSAPDRHFLDTTASCPNLGSMTDKASLGLVPYMGPFDDAVAACDARVAHLDTTTYVVGVESGETTATYCACPYDDARQPRLNPTEDATPTPPRLFWSIEAQYMLHEAGYNPDRLVGGSYGPQTTAMVRALQSDEDLPATGSLDADTWAALESRVC